MENTKIKIMVSIPNVINDNLNELKEKNGINKSLVVSLALSRFFLSSKMKMNATVKRELKRIALE